MNNVIYSVNYVTAEHSNKLIFTYNKLKKIIMPLLNIVIVLIVVGVLLWLVNSYIPMDGKIKRILNIVVVIVVVIWLLNVFGLFSSMRGMRI